MPSTLQNRIVRRNRHRSPLDDLRNLEKVCRLNNCSDCTPVSWTRQAPRGTSAARYKCREVQVPRGTSKGIQLLKFGKRARGRETSRRFWFTAPIKVSDRNWSVQNPR